MRQGRAYQELRDQLQLGRRQELVLAYDAAQAERRRLQERHQQLGDQDAAESRAIEERETRLQEAATKLKTLQDNVKALGEDQLLGVQAELAGLDPQSRELERQAAQHQQEGERLQALRHDLQGRRGRFNPNRTFRLSTDPAALNQLRRCRSAEGAAGFRAVAWEKWPVARAPGWRSSGNAAAAGSSCRPLAPLQAERQQLMERLRQSENANMIWSWNGTRTAERTAGVQTLQEQLDQEWQSVLK